MIGLYDIHCHLIPDVDDGPENIEETIRMLHMEYKEGVRHIIATPHYRKNMFETSIDKIQQQYLRAREEAKKIGDGIDLQLGCEFHVNMDMVDMLRDKKRPTMAGSSYVLSEFSGGSEYAFIKERTYHLLSNGYQPILAHIERYPYLVKHLDAVEELVDMGAQMQVNAGSVMGDDGGSIKRFCRKLMKADLLHFIGTDGHSSRQRAPHIGACAAYIEQKMGNAYAQELLITNPSKITDMGEYDGTEK